MSVFAGGRMRGACCSEQLGFGCRFMCGCCAFGIGLCVSACMRVRVQAGC